MLDVGLVQTLLEASITGAGLVLAVYALIVPISTKILKRRSENLREQIEEFVKIHGEITPESPIEVIKQLEALKRRIETTKSFPSYLSIGVKLSFFLYLLSTLIALAWLLNSNRPIMDFWLPITFVLSTVAFLFVGILSIDDIYSAMKKEYEEYKAEIYRA
jgi:uncharacterized membrane protein